MTTRRNTGKADTGAPVVSEDVPLLSSMTPSNLLNLHARIIDELRARELIRTSNNPVGDFAEYLFCKAFGWNRTGNSNAHLDAIDSDGKRYQIKARKITSHNASRQLGALRDLEHGHFDFLAGVLFSERYEVRRAIIIPHALIGPRAKWVAKTNSHKFFLRDEVWTWNGVTDVTAELQAVDF
ncbi:MAG: hypothetical protein K1X51_03950 [Rhodospirillaceae bacterium]|nr:hypothetical protein [Rhodospirillaceae bacterium]